MIDWEEASKHLATLEISEDEALLALFPPSGSGKGCEYPKFTDKKAAEHCCSASLISVWAFCRTVPAPMPKSNTQGFVL